MTLFKVRDLTRRLSAPDDELAAIVRSDMSAGMNSRVQPSKLRDNQAEVLSNISLDTPGQRSKRPGSVLIGDDVGDVSPVILHNYEIQGATDQFLMYEDTDLWKWTGGASWSSLKSDFTSSTDVGIISAKESGQSPDDVVIVQNGTEQVRFNSSGTEYNLDTNHGLYKTTVMAWYGNRIWALSNDLLQYSDAYPDLDDGSDAFTASAFRVPVGEERAIVATRDLGMIIFGAQAIWSLFPSATPAATDRPEPIITSYGAVSKKGVIPVGDDIYFFAQDGLRSLRRTVQDKLQVGASFPISYFLKDEYEEISWSNIANLSMAYFDNKIFISVPLTATTFKTWIYYPSIDSFVVMEDVHPTAWGKYKVSGEERLYYGKQGQGKVYRAWNGFTDEGTTTTNGTAISSQEDGRDEDFGQPQLIKEGGEIEVEAAASSGGLSLKISARIDGGLYSELGTMSLQSETAPNLDIRLPFNLSDNVVVREKFSLDSLGQFRTVQVRIENTDTSTEDVIVYSVNYVAYPVVYQKG